MISDVLKSPEYYLKNKKKFNREYNWKWKKIAGPDYTGSCSYLFQDFYKGWKEQHPNEYPTHTDFARYYFSHVNMHTQYTGLCKPDCHHYGRSVKQIFLLADRYKELCNDESIMVEQYFDDIVNHVIIETYNGQMREIRLVDEYIRHGFNVEQTSDHWDKNLGVDLIIRKGDVIVDYIQCKPLTTFLGNRNESLIRDRVVFYEKEREKKKECEELDYPYYPTKFILYNEEYPDKWCTLNGKKSFLLEELCTNEGVAIHKFGEFRCM